MPSSLARSRCDQPAMMIRARMASGVDRAVPLTVGDRANRKEVSKTAALKTGLGGRFLMPEKSGLRVGNVADLFGEFKEHSNVRRVLTLLPPAEVGWLLTGRESPRATASVPLSPRQAAESLVAMLARLEAQATAPTVIVQPSAISHQPVVAASTAFATRSEIASFCARIACASRIASASSSAKCPSPQLRRRDIQLVHRKLGSRP